MDKIEYNNNDDFFTSAEEGKWIKIMIDKINEIIEELS
tara:strand:+ start:1660 stop:1773 length:114 start_codon:yes stop_codon:yes gene_type:complete